MRILKDEVALVDGRRPHSRGGNREDGVVQGGGDIEDVGLLVEGEAGRAENERGRVAMMGIALGDFVLALYGDVLVADAQVEPDHRSLHDVGHEQLRSGALVIDREIPRAAEELGVHQGPDKIAVAVDDLEGPLPVRLERAVGRGEVADDDEAFAQNAERGRQTGLFAGEKRRRFAVLPGETNGATAPALGVNFMIVTPVPWRLLELLKLATSTSPGAIFPPDGKSFGTKAIP